MLIQVNSDDIDIKKLIIEKCGKQFSLIKRITKNNFGSSRYKLKSIKPTHSHIDLENYNDNIFLNFDLREKGIVFYFRYKNTEYVEFSPFHSLTFQSNDSSFVLQTDINSYSFEIMNKKNHKSFILKLYKFKNKN